MIPVQWLIDLLIDFKRQGPVNQLAFVLALIGAIVLISGYLRRGYRKIETENAALKEKVKSDGKTITELKHEIAYLKSQAYRQALQSAASGSAIII
jgi:hypothetical protein